MTPHSRCWCTINTPALNRAPGGQSCWARVHGWTEMPAGGPFGYISPVKVQRSRLAVDRGALRALPGGSQPREHEPTDAELIDAFEQGEGRACERLYDRLIGVVEGTLWRV